jgi:hypothetical protein
MSFFVRETRNTARVRIAVYGATTFVLLLAALFCWLQPEGREVAFPLVLFMAIVFAYRLYLSLRILRYFNKTDSLGMQRSSTAANAKQ